MADDVQVVFGAKIDDLVAGVKQINSHLDSIKSKAGEVSHEAAGGFAQIREVLQGLTNPLRAIHDNLGEVAEAFVAAFAVEKISRFFENVAELGTQTERTAIKLGVSTQEVGKLQAAALLTGQDSEALVRTLQRLGLVLETAKDKTTPAAAGLKALGLSAEELLHMPLPDVLGKLSDAFSRLEGSQQKTAIASALFGQRLGPEMLPILNKGKAGLEELGEVAVRTGTAMDEGTTSSLTRLHEAIVEFGLSIKGISINIASSFSPAVQGLLQVLSDTVQAFNDAMKAGGLLADSMSLIVVAIKAVLTALAALIDGIRQVWAAAVAMVDDLGHLFIGLGKAIYDSFHLNFTAAAADLKGILTGSQATWNAYLEEVKAANQKYASEISTIWGTANLGPKVAGGATPAPDLDLGKDKAAAALKAADDEVKVLQDGLARQKILLDQAVAQFKLNEGQKLAAVQRATDEEAALELEVRQKELTLGKLSAEERQTVLNKISQLEQRYATETIKINGDTVAELQKKWQGYADEVQKEINGQLRGLLAGTTSFAQAFKNIIGDMVIAFIEGVEKMVAKWLVSKVTMATADQSATAETTAAAAAATAAQVPSALALIQQKVAEVYAGAAAFFAPTLGPGAPAAAAGVAATVDTTASAMVVAGSAEQGAYNVSGGMWQLHDDETVLPAPAAQAFRDMAEGNGNFGGGGVHFHGMMVDGPSISSLFRTYAGTMAKALNGHLSLNPSSR